MWKSSLLLVFLLSVTYSTANDIAADCNKKEKSVVFLEIAKESILRAKDLYPNCNSYDQSNASNYCGLKEKSFVYLDLAAKMISEAVKDFPSFPEPITKTYADCLELLEDGHKKSGVYKIWLKTTANQTRSVDVFCDMETDGGGWTVVQRRGKYSKQEDFYRDWNDYKVGFGNISEEFWIGNENILALTKDGNTKARFEIENYVNMKAYALYQSFKIADESNFYKLRISSYSGTAGDSMTYSDNAKFSTKDKVNDGNNCPSRYRGGWWYINCAWSNLNALYKPGVIDGDAAFHWYHFKSSKQGLASSEIKLKRK